MSSLGIMGSVKTPFIDRIALLGASLADVESSGGSFQAVAIPHKFIDLTQNSV